VEEFRDASHAAPVDVCLVIDRSGSMFEQGKLVSAQEAATLFLRSLRPADRAALVSFADRATLNRSLTHDNDGVAQSARSLRAYGGTALYDAVFWAVNQVALAPRSEGSVLTQPGRSEARRVVLALTDGNDNRSHITPQQVVAFARDNGVTIYTIGLGSDAQADALDTLARSTAGRYFAAPGPEALAQLYALIARQLHSEYALIYRTPNPRADGTRRAVTVNLRASPGPLSAAGWYQAPGAGSSVVTLGTSNSAGPSLPGEPPLDTGGGAPQALWLLALVPVLAVGIAVYLVWTGRASRLPAPGFRSQAGLLTQEAGGETGGGAAERTILSTNPRLDLRPLRVRAPVTEVGRGEENDVVLDSPRVSRRHARIEVAEGAYHVFDNGSANGTFLNGERVTEAPVSVGDVIRFADQEFRFEGEEGAA
jgi:VWFA-related protein